MILNEYQKNSKLLFLILIIITNIFILLPFIQYQPQLSQGDHGRDLYCFAQTLKGDLPYKDYWWVYGPIMPYYYAAFMKLLGVNIASVLLGKLLIVYLSSIAIFLILSKIVQPTWALFGSVWFLVFNQDFFFTYNHQGGVLFILSTLYCLFLYLKKPLFKYKIIGLACLLILTLVKLNFGLVNLFAFILSIFLIDRIQNNSANSQVFYFLAIFIFPIMILAIYYFFLNGLPMYAVLQCMPYLNSYDPSQVNSLLIPGLLFKMIFQNILNGTMNSAFAGIVIFSILQSMVLFFSKDTEKEFKNEVLLTFIILFIFYLANLHEYLKSGVLYRSFWALPINFILIFVVIGYGIRKIPALMQIILMCSIGFILTQNIMITHANLKPAKTYSQYLEHPRGKIFVGDHPIWIQTVLQTTDFLKKNLKEDELFLALPYDSLYYFLTGKKSPTRQIIFFDYLNIPPEQEEAIIAELEASKVNWVVLSSRFNSRENGLGILGKTYCPLIGAYLEKNFGIAAQIGDWQNEPGWTTPHGTRILKRVFPEAMPQL